MPRTRIKICGITESDPAIMALENGADALGFVLVESPRQVTVKRAEEILAELPRPFEPVGVLRHIDDDTLLDDYSHSCFGVLQVEAENPFWRDEHYGMFLWRVFRLGTEGVAKALNESWVQRLKQPILIEGPRSGVGETCDWTEAAKIARQRRIILAGGLTPDNVADAIRTVRPYGVDVSSGVESTPGKKDPLKIRDFLQAVRDVDRELQ